MINNLMRYPTIVLKDIEVLSTADLRDLFSNGLCHTYAVSVVLHNLVTNRVLIIDRYLTPRIPREE